MTMISKVVKYCRARNTFTGNVVASLGVLYAYMSFLDHCPQWFYDMDGAPHMALLAQGLIILAEGLLFSAMLLEYHWVAQERLPAPLVPHPASLVAGCLAVCLYVAGSWDLLFFGCWIRWLYDCFFYFWCAYWVEWYTGVVGWLIDGHRKPVNMHRNMQSKVGSRSTKKGASKQL